MTVVLYWQIAYERGDYLSWTSLHPQGRRRRKKLKKERYPQRYAVKMPLGNPPQSVKCQVRHKKEDESEDESDSSDSDDGLDDYEVNFFEWNIDYAEKKKTKKHIKDGSTKLFNLFTAQCSLQLFTEIKSSDEFKDLESKQDGTGLLGLIQMGMCSVEKHLQDTWALVSVNKALHTFYQRGDIPNDEYLKLSNS